MKSASDIKKSIVKSLLEKTSDYSHKTLKTYCSFSRNTIFVHNLESVIPGANAISCGITDTGRSYLRFIRIIDNPHFHQEIPVTTFDKLPSAKRRVVGDYLNALKCSPNVKMDFYYHAMTI